MNVQIRMLFFCAGHGRSEAWVDEEEWNALNGRVGRVSR